MFHLEQFALAERAEVGQKDGEARPPVTALLLSSLAGKNLADIM
jgi:hypothetical protein